VLVGNGVAVGSAATCCTASVAGGSGVGLAHAASSIPATTIATVALSTTATSPKPCRTPMSRLAQRQRGWCPRQLYPEVDYSRASPSWHRRSRLGGVNSRHLHLAQHVPFHRRQQVSPGRLRRRRDEKHPESGLHRENGPTSEQGSSIGQACSFRQGCRPCHVGLLLMAVRRVAVYHVGKSSIRTPLRSRKLALASAIRLTNRGSCSNL